MRTLCRTFSYKVSNVGGEKYFTLLDASRGYFQLEIDELDIEKTSVTCHRGLFEFTGMYFGFLGVHATYQHLMNRVLGDAKWQHALAYLDDVVVYSNTFEDHVEHFRDILERLRSAVITLNPAKAQIANIGIQLLGFTIACCRIFLCADERRALLEFLSPTDVSELRRLLTMANFYRQFFRYCGTLQAHLTKMLEKGYTWSLGAEQKSALRTITRVLADTAELQFPDLNRDFVIQTDACDLGLGDVLLQEHGSTLRPVAFASRSLTQAEQNYSISEKECLALVFAWWKLEYYEQGKAKGHRGYGGQGTKDVSRKTLG